MGTSQRDLRWVGDIREGQWDRVGTLRGMVGTCGLETGWGHCGGDIGTEKGQRDRLGTSRGMAEGRWDVLGTWGQVGDIRKGTVGQVSDPEGHGGDVGWVGDIGEGAWVGDIRKGTVGQVGDLEVRGGIAWGHRGRGMLEEMGTGWGRCGGDLGRVRDIRGIGDMAEGTWAELRTWRRGQWDRLGMSWRGWGHGTSM